MTDRTTPTATPAVHDRAPDGAPPVIPPDQRWKVAVARLRPWLVVGALVVLVGPDAAELVGVQIGLPPAWAFWIPFVVGMAASFLPGLAIRAPSTGVAVPVRGRWRAMNSPSTRVPSHGTIAYGQSHAVDLVADPVDGSHPDPGTGSGFRRPEAFPAFGAPLRAPVDGVVVTASDWRRDHRSRDRGWALPWLLVEGMVRELGGPGFVIGNHVVVRRDAGGHVLLAHLQRRSLDVRVEDRVSAGQVVAACGNSGNSSEPHLHLQVMDHRRPGRAAGLPFHWLRETANGLESESLPPTGSHVEA